MENQITEQEIFDTVSFLNGQHRGLEGIEIEEYSDSAVKMIGGFLTTSDMNKILALFPRVNFNDGLIIGAFQRLA